MEVSGWWIITLIVSCILIGAGAVAIWDGNEVKRQFDGLWIPDNIAQNHSGAIETAQTFDSHGDWVCVNTRGMSYKRVVEVCQHESGHELFAEMCEKNATRCVEMIS